MITQDIIAALKECGMEYEGTLGRFMNKEELLVRFLKRFPEDESYLQLAKQLEAGDYKAAFGCAHTLKGVAANLGLESLRRPASEITEMLRHSGEQPVDSARLQEEWVLLQQNYEKLQTILRML